MLAKLFSYFSRRSRTLSLKKLTFLGFSLVSLPLVFALIYSALQVNKLSSQGVQAIFSVTELTRVNQELNERRANLERFSSQYLVLQDLELKSNYLIEQQNIYQLLQQKLSQYHDASLMQLSQQLTGVIAELDLLINDEPFSEQSLPTLQHHFLDITGIVKAINARSAVIIDQQALTISATAEQVSATMLNSLLIIPVTLLIAGLFIYLISSPLKLLIEKIQLLEKGNFEQAVVIDSAPEIGEIADALEMMRLRLQALELQKSSFIRHISHELKTPLAAIREGTELLYDNSVGGLNDEQQEICQIIKTSVQRLQSHIEELLDFNIVLDSTSLQDSETIILAPLLTGVLADHQFEIKRKHLTILQNNQDVSIQSNEKQLQVILDNVLSNAIKYSDEGGNISVDSYLENDQLVLAISDQGPGIDAAIQGKVFEAFFQGPAPTSSQIKGSGLGLTIVKELVMRLNGEINLRSANSDGSGTLIEIRLPRASKINNIEVSK
ncbi:sensor histidine kinase [Thalassotalea sp. PLHSN55]|uniref:sensor histidine kinase n=1 Tax=Thalassotalea sp. PLHSN55 TaxID=3435888 RepID=UPI003F87DA92